MEFEWDEAKRERNRAKHAIDFIGAHTIWEEKYLDPYSERLVAGETRNMALGTMTGDETIIAVVYVWRNGVRLIISARRARRHEREDYKSAFGRGC